MVHDEDDLVVRMLDIATAHFLRLTHKLEAPRQRDIEAMIRAEFAGQTVRIPKATAARRVQRNAAIRADDADGVVITELMRRYNVSAATIRRVVKGKTPCPKTPLTA